MPRQDDTELPDDATKLNYADASRIHRMPIGTLKAHVSRKTIPHIRVGPRSVLFDRATLDAWFAERTVPVGGDK